MSKGGPSGSGGGRRRASVERRFCFSALSPPLAFADEFRVQA